MFPLMLLSMVGARYHSAEPIGPEDIQSPMTRKFIEVDGIRIAYVDSGGTKPPLVFVHGLSSYTSFWEYQLDAFTDTHRVIALDLPGFGASGRGDLPFTPPWYADTVVHWLDALAIERASIVGHSMGGQIALTMAIEHPERVDKLVLSAPAGVERFDAGASRWMKDWWHEGRALLSNETEIRMSFTRAVFNVHDAGVERLIEERVRMRNDPSFQGTSIAVSRSIAGMLDYPVASRLSAVTAPTLIVFGSRDRLIPNPIFTGGSTSRVGKEGHEAIPGSRLVMIPGAGHTVHHDAAEPFNQAVRDFFAGTL